MPTSTIPGTETGSWAAGPTFVILKIAGPWVVGGLITQAWPFHDAGDAREYNAFSLQPFLNFNFGPGYAIGFSPILSADWDAPSGDEWTVPLGLSFSRTTALAGRPMTLGFAYNYNAQRPAGAAGQQISFRTTLLFPAGK